MLIVNLTLLFKKSLHDAGVVSEISHNKLVQRAKVCGDLLLKAHRILIKYKRMTKSGLELG